MQRFVSGEVDILVSTMIVESGLDVPNANTMVVHDAHRFGLAQLYQLRGRVGRSHRRAYCYLLVPDSIDADAEERLKVLEHHTDLGAGLPDRAQGPGAARRGQPARRGAVGPRPGRRVRPVPALAGGDGAGAAGAGGTARRRPAARGGARPAGPPAGLATWPTTTSSWTSTADWRGRRRSGDIDAASRRNCGSASVRFPRRPRRCSTWRGSGCWAPTLGLQHLLVRGDEARLTFRAGAAPRMAGLVRRARRRAAGGRGAAHRAAGAAPRRGWAARRWCPRWCGRWGRWQRSSSRRRRGERANADIGRPDRDGPCLR